MAETNSPASFVENVNTVANATKASTGDIVEDAGIARDGAEAAALEAEASAVSADDSETLAQEWATKQYNNPVEPGQYSAYHWSVVAAQNSGDNLISDGITSLNYTWSSDKINTALTGKSNTDHLHTGVYEPVITKGTAFNKNFPLTGGDNGSSVDVARSNHSHSALYEPVIGAKGTGFNKDFGTATGTVAEGDHTHSGMYMPYQTEQTAYNKPFVVDTTNPLATEVPRGNHIHPAAHISYDNIGNDIIVGSTVQTALSQLDAYVGDFIVAEKSKIVAGMATASDTMTVTTGGVGVKLITGMTVSPNVKNASYSAGDIIINYPEAPVKFVEGWYSASVTVTVGSNIEYGMGIWINDVLLDSSFRSQLGSDANNTEGDFAFGITGFVSGLSNGDRLSVGLYNMTNTTDITIVSHTASFAGEPEGALVTSGTSVDHSDLTGTGAPNGVHTISDIQNLVTTLDSKIDTVPLSTAGNIVIFDATGKIEDSGESITTVIDDYMKLTPTPVLDNVITMTTTGDSKNSGLSINDIPDMNGNANEPFKVGASSIDSHAVRKDEMAAMAADYTPIISFTAHENATNPHNITTTNIGAAEAVHTHTQGDVTGLTDSLQGKYDVVSTAATDNLVAFDHENTLQDAGVSVSELAPIHSPSFSGTPTTPNSTANDNSGKIANTRYVDEAISNIPDSGGIGVDQTWQDVSGSRVFGTDYTNNTGKPIQVSIASASASITASFLVDGVTVARTGATGTSITISIIVPDGSIYRWSSNTSISVWVELR